MILEALHENCWLENSRTQLTMPWAPSVYPAWIPQFDYLTCLFTRIPSQFTVLEKWRFPHKWNVKDFSPMWVASCPLNFSSWQMPSYKTDIEKFFLSCMVSFISFTVMPLSEPPFTKLTLIKLLACMRSFQVFNRFVSGTMTSQWKDTESCMSFIFTFPRK